MDPTYTNATSGALTHEERVRASPRVVRQHAKHKVHLDGLPPLLAGGTARGRQYFPVSVCCTSDYCFMDSPDTTFRYRCEKKDECFLLKEGLVVQALPSPSPSAGECRAAHEGAPGLFPFLPEATRKQVCGTP